MKKEVLSPTEAYARILRYCAYQERSHREVRDKLYEYGLHKSQVEELLSRAIVEGFLNEERFARAFAGGKFRMKKWGRNKIIHELEAHGVTPRCIRIGLEEIGRHDYEKSLRTLIQKKVAQTREDNLFRKRDKVAKFIIGKGYEPELVWEVLKEATD